MACKPDVTTSIGKQSYIRTYGCCLSGCYYEWFNRNCISANAIVRQRARPHHFHFAEQSETHQAPLDRRQEHHRRTQQGGQSAAHPPHPAQSLRRGSGHRFGKGKKSRRHVRNSGFVEAPRNITHPRGSLVQNSSFNISGTVAKC